MSMTRRSFLRLVGVGVAGVSVPTPPIARGGGHAVVHCGKKCCLAVVETGSLGQQSVLFSGSGAAVFAETGESAANPFTPAPGQTEQRFLWQEVLFFAQNPDLGEIHVTLNNSRESTGIIESLSLDEDRFFPARAKNDFFFEMKIPRLGVTLVNEEPLRNVTEINEWPPHGSTYVQESTVSFQGDSDALDCVSIRESQVTISEENGLKVTLQLLSKESNERYRFKGTIASLNPDELIDVVVYATSQGGALGKHRPNHAFLTVGESPVPFEFTSEFIGRESSGVLELHAASLEKGVGKWGFASEIVSRDRMLFR